MGQSRSVSWLLPRASIYTEDMYCTNTWLRATSGTPQMLEDHSYVSFGLAEISSVQRAKHIELQYIQLLTSIIISSPNDY